MATSAGPASSAWAPHLHPTRVFTELRRSAHTDEDRACLAAATRQADRVWIALHNGILGNGAPTSPIPPRNPVWHRLALSEYELLRTSGAYGHLAQLRPWSCAAAEAVLTVWLNSPTTPDQHTSSDPGDAVVTVAQRLRVGDAVNFINGDTQVAHLSTVLHAAQDAAVFGVPRHRVELVTAAAADHDRGTVVRVVVDTPTGLALASQPLELGVLIDPDMSGVAGATAALRKVADIATGLFAVHARAVWDAPPPQPSVDRSTTPVGRAFPELGLHRAAATPVPPTPSPRPAPAPASQPHRASPDADRNGRSR